VTEAPEKKIGVAAKPDGTPAYQQTADDVMAALGTDDIDLTHSTRGVGNEDSYRKGFQHSGQLSSRLQKFFSFLDACFPFSNEGSLLMERCIETKFRLRMSGSNGLLK
jgi:hypothetical protein